MAWPGGGQARVLVRVAGSAASRDLDYCLSNPRRYVKAPSASSWQ
jgi:hypothetical protein